METKASHVTVGAFVLALVAAVFIFVLWMSKSDVKGQASVYRIYFTSSVTGLQQGSAVRFRGIPVGRVTDIRIDPTNVERVQVTVEIPESVPIKQDAQAALTMQGITGTAYIQISGNTQTSPALLPVDGQSYAEIPSQTSVIDQVFESAPELLDRFVVLADRATQMLGPQNQESFSEILANISAVTGAVANRSDDIDGILGDARGTMTDLRQAASDLSKLSNTLQGSVQMLADEAGATFSAIRGTALGVDEQMHGVGGQLQASLAQLRSAADNFSNVAASMNRLVGDNEEAFSDFANHGLYEFTLFVSEARGLVTTLNRLTNRVERNPAGFLFGDTQRGVEAE